MADEKLIFPIGFDLEGGVKEASKEWKNTYQKQLQKAIDDKPLKVKIDFESKGIDTKEFKQWMALSREAEKLERERIKNAKEWQKVADQAAMAETRRANATNESNARIERANRKAEASEMRKKDAVERTTAAYKTQSSYLSRLVQRMVAYASVAQAFSFVRNVRDVTAEFELQRVALGSIIGDLNEANAMFEQIKAAAVKSPFQIKELVTYTKQLAAYKIESDELFETTQRLADISAGLGVGMERLVLAYGQIRATGYLRASEVRQLTEAGIPIVEELAKKMSQLRGETVSAAEVMGLISERAISFGMVKEVFDDMTSAGGMFYKMQEKQAETLAGQWSNLQDAISIMYEEIGNTETAQNGIKGMIGLVKSLAENWRTVGVVMITALEGYGVYKGFSALLSAMTFKMVSLAVATKNHEIASNKATLAIARFGKVGRLMTWHLTKQTKLLKQAAKETNFWRMSLLRLRAFLAGNIWNIALIGIGALVAKIVSARIEANRLNKELERIGAEGDVQSRTQVNNFERLAKVIRDSADGSLRQTEALKEMKRAYGEFLPSQDKEIVNLVRAKEGYEAVSQAIREKIALQVQEQKVNAVTSEYSKIISDYLPDLKTLLEPEGIDVSRVYSALKTAIENGSLALIGSVKEDAEAINAILEKELGITLDLFNEGRQLTIKGWKSVFNPSRAMELLRPILNAETKLRNAIQDIEYDLLSDTGITGIYAEKWTELQKNLNDITAKGEVNSFEWNKDKTRQEIELYHNFIKERIAEINEGLSNDKKIKFDIGDVLDFDALDEALGNNYPQLKQVVAKIQKEYEKLIPTDITRLANDKLQEYAEKVGISMDDVKEHLKTNEQSTEDWAKGIKSSYESLEKILAEYKLNRDNAISIGKKSHWSKAVEEVEDEMKVLKLLMDFFKEFLSQSGGGTKQRKSQLSILQEELQLHEKIYAKYKEYRKYKSAEEAKAKVEDYFGDTIKSLMFEPKYDSQGFKQVLKQYQDYARTLPESEKVVLDIGFKVGDIDWQDTKTELEDSLKKLSDDISRTKTAKEFFDRMLGLTGDKQLSASLTVSIYGGKMGDDLGERLAKDVATKFQEQVQTYFGDIDISGAINEATGEIEPIALEKLLTDENIKAIGEDNVKEIRKIIADLVSANAKYWDDLMKDLEKARTYGDKLVKVYETTQERIAKVNAREDLDADAKKQLIDQINELQGKEMQKLQYEAFKDSPMYVAMFEKLDTTSTTMLKNMRNHLVKLKSEWKNLDPTQLKELQSRINEIDKQLSARNPFKSIVDGIKEFNALQKIGSRKDAEETLAYASERRLRAERRYKQAVADGKSDEEIKRLASYLNKCVEAENEATKKMSEWDDATQKVVQGINDLQQVVNLVQTTTTAVNDIVEAFGGWGDAADEEFWNTILDGINGFMSGIQSVGTGVAQIMTGDILGGVTSLVSGIGSVVSAIGDWIYADRIRDANKEIERQQESLDQLAYSYERLEKAQEKAFGSDYISNYEQRLANLQAQQEAYLKQAEAERSKGKKADEDKIKEYEEAYREATDNIKDMQTELSEYFLGTDLTSAARDFASAWIDAYKEFGSTTDAMKAKFQDMIQNMIVESFAAKVIQSALSDIFTEIDNMTKDGVLDVSEASKIADMTEVAVGNIDVGMTNLMNALSQAGLSVRGMGSELTGISRDIATASEESILGLAAGINTQNFYISQVPTKLDTIIGLLRGENAMQGSAITLQDLITIQNQHLSHLPSIAQHTADTVAECKQIVAETRRTADALERVIKPRGTISTHSMNVTIGS